MVRITAISSQVSPVFMAIPHLLLMARHLNQLYKGVIVGNSHGSRASVSCSDAAGDREGRNPPLPQPVPVIDPG